jgi:hypothetical protein
MRHILIYIAIVVGVLLILSLLAIWRKRRAPKLNPAHFAKRWRALQKNCLNRRTWPRAIIDADNLLDEALRCRHYKGKTTGERLVAAQHILTDNELVWFGHKLSNRIAQEDVRKLKKQDILEALKGFRQALRDLGALGQ